MDLQFVRYIFSKKKLYFNIVVDQLEILKLSQFQTELFSKVVLQSNAQLIVKNTRIIITELKDSSHINFVLLNIKSCCERNGVRNWDEFSKQIKLACNIQEKSTNLLNLSTLPKDMLNMIASKFLGIKSISKMLQVSKKIYNDLSNPEVNLKTYYPEIYHKHKEEKFLTNKTMYQKLFLDAYVNESKSYKPYYNINSGFTGEKVIKLSFLFKHGDLEAIQASGITLDIMLKINYPFLYWSHLKGHTNILSYFFEKPVENALAKHPLFKAICCFQSQEVLLSAAHKTDLNSVLNDMTPLMTAVKFNNVLAVEFLCRQKKVLINYQVPDYGNVAFNTSALAYALSHDNLEIAKYLLLKGALFDASIFFYGTPARQTYCFVAWVGERCKKYLLENPVTALELQKHNKRFSSTPYNQFSGLFYSKKIHNWLKQNKSDSLFPIFNHLNSYNYDEDCTIQKTHHYIFFTLIIEQFDKTFPEVGIQLIEAIKKFKNADYVVEKDPLLQKILNQLKEKFLQLQVQPIGQRVQTLRPGATFS